MTKPTVCLDFNGVLDMYSGWVKGGNGTEYPPRPGTQYFLERLSGQYKVVILTAIDPLDVAYWLSLHNLERYIADITNVKPPAVAYIDDRAIQFNGDYEDTLEQLQNFKVYWEE